MTNCVNPYCSKLNIPIENSSIFCRECNHYTTLVDFKCDCRVTFKGDIINNHCVACYSEVRPISVPEETDVAGTYRKTAPALGDQAKSVLTSIDVAKEGTPNLTQLTSLKEPFKLLKDDGRVDPLFSPPPTPDKIDTAKEVLLDEAKEAGWRVAADQYLETAKRPVMAALYKSVGIGGKSRASASARDYVGKFLESDLGDSLFTYGLSFSTQFLPYQKPIAKRIAKELRIKAQTKAFNKVINMFMNPMREAMVKVITGTPQLMSEKTEESPV